MSNVQSSRPWRYQLQSEYTVQAEHLRGVSFYNQWLRIDNGAVTVSKHYAWDGCTPKYFLPIIGWVGVPDGALTRQGVPQAYYASLVHDAMCQFRYHIPVTKEDTLRLFRDQLLEGGFGRARAELYTGAVRLFGPQQWRGRST